MSYISCIWVYIEHMFYILLLCFIQEKRIENQKSYFLAVKIEICTYQILNYGILENLVVTP
jgi:hypothetical protein